ncbi:MAG: cytochrome c3 family protein [Holophagales bacterium]|jgi:hypothetical protein|nr:cytochrome c3 family protein [Holophagales bacterium]MBK9969084.1 cytochrome c3 family protein [Holophagales bacterium]
MRRLPLALTLGFAFSFSAFAVDPPKDVRTFETARGPVAFAHTKHLAAGAVCADCHHTGVQKKCSTCHGKVAKGKVPRFLDAVHDRTLKHACLTCHAARVEAGKKAPLACTACHPKG